MNEPVTRHTISTAPPSIALAVLAQKLAVTRFEGGYWPWWVESPPRRGCFCKGCRHYFEIIDALSDEDVAK